MTVFYLIRHGNVRRGQRDRPPGDVPLTERGIDQAQATAAQLQSRPIAAVYSSPLRRAAQTATYIATAQGLTVIGATQLRERANWGNLPGQSFTEFIAMWERCSRERDYQPPVGDSSRAAGARVERFVETAWRTYPQAEVVAVAHGGVIADFLRNVFPPAQLAAVNPAFAAEPYGATMVECAISVVAYDGQRYRLRAIAENGHLADKHW